MLFFLSLMPWLYILEFHGRNQFHSAGGCCLGKEWTTQRILKIPPVSFPNVQTRLAKIVKMMENWQKDGNVLRRCYDNEETWIFTLCQASFM